MTHKNVWVSSTRGSKFLNYMLLITMLIIKKASFYIFKFFCLDCVSPTGMELNLKPFFLANGVIRVEWAL